MRHRLFVLPLVFLLFSCGIEASDDSSEDTSRTIKTPAEPANESGGGSHHGAVISLGSVELDGETFSISRHGPCVAGKEGAFSVDRLGSGRAANLFLWVENSVGQQVSAPAQAGSSSGSWHFHAMPLPESAPSKVVLRLREGDRDARAGLPLYAGAASRHDGVAAPLRNFDNTIAGWVEFKLHDDKGDLELWLAKDQAMLEPMDLPLDTVIQATFAVLDNRTVELRVRNTTKNEDENGTPNIRDGGTHYFIFPGSTGEDASMFQGKDFKSAVTLTIPTTGNPLTAGPFVLVPHHH